MGFLKLRVHLQYCGRVIQCPVTVHCTVAQSQYVFSLVLQDNSKPSEIEEQR